MYIQQVAIFSLGFFLSHHSGGSFAMVALASCVFALFLQQSGWLAHDILHHQVARVLCRLTRRWRPESVCV